MTIIPMAIPPLQPRMIPGSKPKASRNRRPLMHSNQKIDSMPSCGIATLYGPK